MSGLDGDISLGNFFNLNSTGERAWTERQLMFTGFGNLVLTEVRCEACRYGTMLF
ncbi:MAG: hypothetical protein RR998_00185 [Oscillospiraceae bacterium]